MENVAQQEIWDREEDEDINSLPDTICPVCDGVKLYPGKKCEDCGYDELVLSEIFA